MKCTCAPPLAWCGQPQGLPSHPLNLPGRVSLDEERTQPSLFLGTAPLLTQEMAFRRTAEHSVLTLWKKSAVSQLRAQFSLSLLEPQPVLPGL